MNLSTLKLRQIHRIQGGLIDMLPSYKLNATTNRISFPIRDLIERQPNCQLSLADGTKMTAETQHGILIVILNFTLHVCSSANYEYFPRLAKDATVNKFIYGLCILFSPVQSHQPRETSRFLSIGLL